MLNDAFILKFLVFLSRLGEQKKLFWKEEGKLVFKVSSSCCYDEYLPEWKIQT